MWNLFKDALVHGSEAVVDTRTDQTSPDLHHNAQGHCLLSVATV